MPNVLGVRLDSVTKKELEQKFRDFLDGTKHNIVVTPNSEMVLKAHRNLEYRERLNRSDLSICDGTGVMLASLLTPNSVKKRITGVDALDLLAEVASEEGKSMYLLGGYPDEAAEHAAGALKLKHPELIVHGNSGGRIWYDRGIAASPQKSSAPRNDHGGGEWHMNPQILDDIKTRAPDILVVALGHGRQEHWMESFVPHLPSVRLAIGVGGALDFLAGNLRRAPKWMRDAGLEWVFRLMMQPTRIRRIINAVIVFPIVVIWDRINRK